MLHYHFSFVFSFCILHSVFDNLCEFTSLLLHSFREEEREPTVADLVESRHPRGRFDGAKNLKESECSARGELILWLFQIHFVLQFLFKYGTDCIIHLVCLVPLYGGPQLSHQNKMRTSNSNHSQQIQITHSKFKSLTANSNCSQQITNPPQQITNRSHQIQIAHSRYKSLTAGTNTVSVKGGVQSADCGLRDCRLQSRGKSRLRVK